MDVIELIGYIALFFGCIVIILKLLMVYKEEKNILTINGILCFSLAAIVFLVAIFISNWVLNIASEVIVWFMILALALQFALILDALTALKVMKLVRFIIVAVYAVLVLVGLIIPEIFMDATLNSIILIILLAVNTVLFLIYWKAKDDVESFGFAIGLALIIIGDIMLFIVPILAGVFFVFCVIIWLLGYFGVLEKVMGEEDRERVDKQTYEILVKTESSL